MSDIIQVGGGTEQPPAQPPQPAIRLLVELRPQPAGPPQINLAAPFEDPWAMLSLLHAALDGLFQYHARKAGQSQAVAAAPAAALARIDRALQKRNGRG